MAKPTQVNLSAVKDPVAVIHMRRLEQELANTELVAEEDAWPQGMLKAYLDEMLYLARTNRLRYADHWLAVVWNMSNGWIWEWNQAGKPYSQKKHNKVLTLHQRRILTARTKRFLDIASSMGLQHVAKYMGVEV